MCGLLTISDLYFFGFFTSNCTLHLHLDKVLCHFGKCCFVIGISILYIVGNCAHVNSYDFPQLLKDLELSQNY